MGPSATTNTGKTSTREPLSKPSSPKNAVGGTQSPPSSGRRGRGWGVHHAGSFFEKSVLTISSAFRILLDVAVREGWGRDTTFILFLLSAGHCHECGVYTARPGSTRHAGSNVNPAGHFLWQLCPSALLSCSPGPPALGRAARLGASIPSNPPAGCMDPLHDIFLTFKTNF